MIEPQVSPSDATREALSKLTEDRLRLLLLQLFAAMGFQDVFHYHGGSLEQGKDITMWKAGELGERVNYAVVVKRGDVTGKAAGKGGAGDIETQVRQSFGTPFKDKLTSADQDVHQCWVVASGKIPKEALLAIQSSLERTNLRAQTKFIDGEKLSVLVAKHLPGKTLLTLVDQVRRVATEVDENYNIALSISPAATKFQFEPKTDSPQPLAMHFSGIFTEDEEGQKAQADYESFIKKGTPFKVAPSQITQIELPDVMRKMMGDPQHHSVAFEFTPNIGEPVPCKLEARSDSGEQARLELIELRRIRAGTEELILSNEQQCAAVAVQLTVNFSNNSVNVQFKSHCAGNNAALVAEWFRFQKVISQPAVIVMQQILTGIEFGRHRTNGLFPAPDPALAEIANALSFIQRHTGALFAWPEMIPAFDQIQIDNVLDIIHTGRAALDSIAISLPTDGLARFMEAWNSNPERTWHVENHQISILGVPVGLGPVDVACADSQIEIFNQSGAGPETQAVIKPTPGTHLEAVFPKFPRPHSQSL